ncbi:MAG: M20 family metallopeptidase [Planctomycetota bacterium]
MPAVNANRLHALFEKMVDLYSPSGKEEELADFLESALTAAGLDVQRQQVEGSRANLLVSAGAGEEDLLFLGHIDTVPAYDMEHLGFTEDGGLCYGLGTADMKSGCAAMIEAFVSATAGDALPENVLLALVVGEEETGDGTKALLDSRRFREALVAEPTDLQPCLEHYGYVELVVRAFGYRRHAAMSDRETNAIHGMLRFLIHLTDRIESDEPQTVLNIRDLHSSQLGFAVPDRCAAAVDLHIPPDLGAADYAQSLRGFVEAELSASRASKHELEFLTLADGFRVPDDADLTGQLRQVFAEQGRDWNPRAFKSHSDANLLHEAGCPPVILGPGQLAKAHTRDESVEFQQVLDAANIYAHLLTEGLESA